MDDRDAYMEYVGDCVGKAENDLLNEMTDSIAKALKVVKEISCKEKYKKIVSVFKEHTPICTCHFCDDAIIGKIRRIKHCDAYYTACIDCCSKFGEI